MQEKDAIKYVEDSESLKNALDENYVGHYVEDDGSEYCAMVVREDDEVHLWICEDTHEHKIVVDLVFHPYKPIIDSIKEIMALWDTMCRVYDGGWTFYDKDIFCDMPYEKIPSLTRMAYEAEH